MLRTSCLPNLNCRHLFVFIFLVAVLVLMMLVRFTSVVLLSDTTRKMGFGYNAAELRSPMQLWSRWIVITSVAPPTDDVIYMASLPGWRVLVIGDEKTPVNWSYPNCTYLDLADQKALGFGLTSKLPFRSYTRKNIGYLYAILHGAKVIFDTDDDNRPLDNFSSFHMGVSTVGLVVDNQDSHLFNPYPHFGQPTLWPRGFPLANINGQETGRNYRFSTDLDRPLIQQGLVKGDPDLDAIFRLTRKGKASVFNVTYDPVSPPIFLPAGMYSPINSQNTLFHYKAFWALLLPTTTAFRVCDIWRGYWAQRLLWEVGGSLEFPAANARQSRNAHSYLKDALEETQMYFHTDRLLDFLSSWSCPQDLSFFACVELLSFDMAEKGFWGKEDAENTRSWLRDLLNIGYREPKRIFFTSNGCKNRTSLSKLSSSNDSDESHGIFVYNMTKTNYVHFVPVDQKAPSLDSLEQDITLSPERYLNQVISVCPNLLLNNLAHLRQQFKVDDIFQDVLLIIIFHYPHYNNLRFMEASYRPRFPNIAYCGPEAHTFRKSAQDLGRNLTFIEAHVQRGYFAYVCLIKAIAAGFHVAGYLVIADDLLLNFWSFGGFNKTNIWIARNNIFPLDTRSHVGWHWWDTLAGREAWFNAHSELSKTQVPSGIPLPSDCYQTLQNNIHRLGIPAKPGRTVHGTVDIYYVPKRFAPSVRWYFTVFLRHHLFLEIAIPTVLLGLQNVEEMEVIHGRYLWNEMRDRAWVFFDRTHHFLHPIKLSQPINQNGYCDHFAPLLMKHTMGIVLESQIPFARAPSNFTFV